jgi:hypothetical protein
VNIDLVDQIVADANANGVNFVLEPGDQVAVVVDILDCTGSPNCHSPHPPQIAFIPATCGRCTGAIGDYVWQDRNRDGLQTGEGDAGINGVTVQLKGSNGQVLATTTTFTGGPNNKPGYYQFFNKRMPAL